ncbi:FAD-dependent monooxygenase [Neisseria sp. Ec49-e6-T10]|uniref:FAD-dependent monooxygenase n=1 Tax=Neisseria sp. Ec49-e6-T10 TaxID=3140744 RepID=UPI003EBD411F
MNHYLEVDAVIVGGGLVGAATALSLHLLGKKVILLELGQPKIDSVSLHKGWDPRIYAISPANQVFLESLGAWPPLADRAQAVMGMDVKADAGGYITFEADQFKTDRLATIIENRYLLASIWAQLAQHNVPIIQGQRAKEIATYPDKAIVTLENEQKIEAKLVVGADGANSWVRRELNIDIKVDHYFHHGVVANFECQLDHQGVAYQWFEDGEILAYLPLPNKRMSMVWSTREPQRLLDMDEAALANTVAARGHHTLGQLEVITSAHAFELRLIRPQTTYAHRVVLIGDAAHTIHPLAGQGVNLGFGDVIALSALLKGQKDIGQLSLLKRYALTRVEPVRLMQLGCDGLFKLFEARHLPGISWVRNTGLRLVNKSQLIKKQLIKQAMGW